MIKEAAWQALTPAGRATQKQECPPYAVTLGVTLCVRAYHTQGKFLANKPLALYSNNFFWRAFQTTDSI